MEKELVTRLISARKDKNWTQLDLAKALGVNLKNVQRWEQGSSKPSFEAATELAKVLGVSLDYLAGIANKPNPNQLDAEALQVVNRLSNEQLKAVLVLVGVSN